MRATIIAFTIVPQATVTAYLPDGPAKAERHRRSPPSGRPVDRGLFSADEYRHMRAFFAARPELGATPLRHLPSLARALGLGHVGVKDETTRFGLNAFKLLGARFAVETLRAEGALPPGHTVACASEGNHGRAVARAARDAGCYARVYMAADAAQARAEAIAGEGATVVRVNGSYDDAVRMLRTEAVSQGWTIVSDTSWEGYERIPRLIMLGYTRMMDEVAAASASSAFDFVFVQGGVGGLLCGIASWCATYAPHCQVVSVEPTSAACLLASARAGRPTSVDGPLTTTMAGLRNREISPMVFRPVRATVDAYLAIDDTWAHRAIWTLAHPDGGDAVVAAGASGAAALGGVLAVCLDPGMRAVRERLGLHSASRVLAVVSEGVTDPALWTAVTDGVDPGQQINAGHAGA